MVQYSFRQSILDQKAQIALQLQNEDPFIRKQAKKSRRKRKLYLRQRGRCCFCESKMWLCYETSPTVSIAATNEHIIPKSQAPRGIKNNIAISCHRCNKIRGVIEFELFKQIVKIVPYDQLPMINKKPVFLGQVTQTIYRQQNNRPFAEWSERRAA